MSAVTVPQLEGCVIEVTTDFEHQVNCRVLEYWQSLCERTPDIGPQVSNFEITDIIECAPYLIYKDVIDSGYDFRNRYWGTQLIEWYKLETTGMLLKDYYPPEILHLGYKFYRNMHAVGAPVYSIGDVGIGNMKHVIVEGVYLPLLDETGKIGHIFAVEEIIDQ